MKFLTFFQLLLLYISQIASGQNDITLEDYKRAVGFLGENINNKKVYNLHIQAHWFPDSTGLWYVHHSPDSKKYHQISLPGLQRSELFDHHRLAALLSDSLDSEISADKLPLTGVEYRNKEELLISTAKKDYILNRETYTLIPAGKEKEDLRKEELSPDKKWIVFQKDYNLHLRSTGDSAVRQLSNAGKKGYEYASWYGWYDIMEGENGERPAKFRVNWSDNSQWISTTICDLRTAQKMYLLDWSVDSLYRPRLLSYYRGSPGDTGMVYIEPVFFHVPSGREIRPPLPRSTHINDVRVEWSGNPGQAYLSRSSRGYQNLSIYSFDLNTEELETLYSESSATNIDNFTHRFAEEDALMFFLSEKSGWRQLYTLDLETRSEHRISRGDYYVNRIVRIDENSQRIYFLASGREQGRNPYYQHLYSISFSGKDLNLLTPENFNHHISIAPAGDFFVDNYSTVNQATTTVLRDMETGHILLELGHADASALGDWKTPEILTALARDGKTTIYGALWKPVNFNPEKKYPIIELSYTGPHTHLFPTEFSRAFMLQPYAELGFIGLVVDGLGSSGRSKEFHDWSYKNLGGNLEDHVLAIRQLGKQYSWMDTTRVGIFGHSAGGYDAAHALLAYPEFYKVAVASSADHDHRMEKAWWPEMYMGWPVDSAYHLQSNITMAANLKGRLLITHGGIDDNVNPSATFKLAEALIRADKQFDMLILPSQRHGYDGQHQKYFTKRRWNYFVEHLRGVEPIWDFPWE
jgi:dipeptidyl-peptidase-4